LLPDFLTSSKSDVPKCFRAVLLRVYYSMAGRVDCWSGRDVYYKTSVFLMSLRWFFVSIIGAKKLTFIISSIWAVRYPQTARNNRFPIVYYSRKTSSIFRSF